MKKKGFVILSVKKNGRVRERVSARTAAIRLWKQLRWKNCLLALAGAAIQAVGICNIHAYSGVTEGGVLGMTLLLHHWFQLSPAVSSLALNAACYLLGLKTMGREFIVYSLLAGGGFSLFYALCEPFAPLWPTLVTSPLACALIGAVFVGVGAGLSVRAGGAPGGDDALAMSVCRLVHCDIQWVYLFSDLTVLALSATYIPWQRLGYSLLTVILSGQIIGVIQRLHTKKA